METVPEIIFTCLKIIVSTCTLIGTFFGLREYGKRRAETKAKLIMDLNLALSDDGLSEAVELLEEYRDELRKQQVKDEIRFSPYKYLLEESIPTTPVPNAVSHAQVTEDKEAGADPKASAGNNGGKNDISVDMSLELIAAHNALIEGWAKVRNLLRFFETILLMIETGAVNEADLFRCMGYRMLLVLNCPLVQKKMLFSHDMSVVNGTRFKYSFVSMFELHRRLMSHLNGSFNIIDGQGLTYNSLLEDYKINPIYSLELAPLSLWNIEKGVTTNAYKAAIESYRKLKKLKH